MLNFVTLNRAKKTYAKYQVKIHFGLLFWRYFHNLETMIENAGFDIFKKENI